MNKSESKYFNTACIMDEALLYLLEKKDFEYITIKEICKKAGVNRSTFYLHYENTSDLLAEAISLINKRFFEVFKNNTLKDINACSKEEVIFIKEEYLLPYLEFVKENKRVFKTIHQKPEVFQAEKTFEKMYKNVFLPVLDKFNVPKEDKDYIFEFFTKGTLAIIMKWVSNGCIDSEEYIMNMIIGCININDHIK